MTVVDVEDSWGCPVGHPPRPPAEAEAAARALFEIMSKEVIFYQTFPPWLHSLVVAAKVSNWYSTQAPFTWDLAHVIGHMVVNHQWQAEHVNWDDWCGVLADAIVSSGTNIDHLRTP